MQPNKHFLKQLLCFQGHWYSNWVMKLNHRWIKNRTVLETMNKLTEIRRQQVNNVKQIQTVEMESEKKLPETNALEIIPSTGKGDEGDEYARLHLSHPLFRLTLLNEYDRFDSPATRRCRGAFPARKPLQSRLHLFPPSRRRRARTPRPTVRPSEPLRRRRGVRLRVAFVLMLCWSGTRVTIPIRSGRFQRHVLDLKIYKRSNLNPQTL